MEDEKIISLYWARNEAAICETAAKYGKYCHTIAYNVLGSHEDAKECVNDTWKSTWDAIPPERPRSLGGFLARITRNIAIDRYRHDTAQKRGAKSVIEEYWECIPSEDAPLEDEVALKQAIDRFLAGLDTRSRVIFLRRYWYAMSVGEIAAGMRLTESHVSVILHRTKQKFKDHLKKEGIFS